MALKMPNWFTKLTSTLWHTPGRSLKNLNNAASVAMWAQIGAGVAATLLLYWYGRAILHGPWPDGVAANQLSLLGQGQILSTIIALVALTAVAGLRIAFKGSKDGFGLSAERDDPDDHQTVVQTVIDDPADPAIAPTAETTVTRDGKPVAATSEPKLPEPEPDK